MVHPIWGFFVIYLNFNKEITRLTLVHDFPYFAFIIPLRTVQNWLLELDQDKKGLTHKSMIDHKSLLLTKGPITKS